MSERLATCALCPRLCRPACPVTVATGREAAVPTWLAQAALDARRGMLGAPEAASWLSLCTDCGACESHCHIHHPLPRLLREARAELGLLPEPEPVGAIEGEGERVAVECDGRPLARALTRHLGEPVARLTSHDRLGVAARGGERWCTHLDTLRHALAGRTAIVVDGGAARVLEDAGCAVRTLGEFVELDEAVASCALPGADAPGACCGGAEPLVSAHPGDAARLAERWIERHGVRVVADGRCREHLCRYGDVRDPLDHLMEELGWAEPEPS